MRTFVALCVAAMACLVAMALPVTNANGLTALSPSFAELDSEFAVEADEEAELDMGTDADSEHDSLMHADAEEEALAGLDADAEADSEAHSEAFGELDVEGIFSAVEAGAKALNGDIHEEYAFGSAGMPTDKQLPGDVVQLKHAPGAAPVSDEEKIPKTLLLGADEKTDDPNYKHDIELWGKITKAIKLAKKKIPPFRKWNTAAVLAVRRIKAQLDQTKKNTQIMNDVMEELMKKRRKSVMKLKEWKLKADLEVAEKEMKAAEALGSEIVKQHTLLAPDAEELARKVRTLERGLKELRVAGQDN